MRKCLLLIALLVLPSPMTAQSNLYPNPLAADGGLVALTTDCATVTQCVILPIPGVSRVAIQLTGSWTATVQFEATINGTWVAWNMVPSNSATAASSATANGAWTSQVIGGMTQIRVRPSAYTQGIIGVSIRALP